MATSILVHWDDFALGLAIGTGRDAATADAIAIVRYCEACLDASGDRRDPEQMARTATDVAAEIDDGELVLVRI